MSNRQIFKKFELCTQTDKCGRKQGLLQIIANENEQLIDYKIGIELLQTSLDIELEPGNQIRQQGL